MPFLHPILFWLGLGGISIPIVIHILNRRRFKIVDWAAMRFLLEAMRKNRRRLRLEELLLLALRCLIVLLIGVALARFVGCSALDTLPTGGVSAVFVVDDSLSMGQKWGDKSAFELARADLAERIAPMTMRDQVGIWLTSRPKYADALLRLGPIEDPETLVGRINALEPSGLRTCLSDAVETAARTLKDVEGTRRLVILSDVRRADLTEPGEADRLAGQIRELREAGVEVVVLDYGRAAQNNLTVERLELLSRFAVVGAPVRIRLAVRNNGTQPTAETPVTLSGLRADGEDGPAIRLPVETLPALQPGELVEREINFQPARAGDLAIEAALPADELPGDNTVRLVLDVKPRLRVLVVDGRRDPENRENDESFFVVKALDPNADGSHGFAVDTITPATLSSTDLSGYDAVILADVASLPGRLVAGEGGSTMRYPEVEALERYVSSGGGLIVFAGPDVKPAFYNEALVREGRGLLPFNIGRAVGDPEGRQRWVHLDPKTISPTGLMSFFSGEAAAATQLVRFFGYTSMDAERTGSQEGATIEARFDDPPGSPAVVSKRFGKGQTALGRLDGVTAVERLGLRRRRRRAGALRAVPRRPRRADGPQAGRHVQRAGRHADRPPPAGRRSAGGRPAPPAGDGGRTRDPPERGRGRRTQLAAIRRRPAARALSTDASRGGQRRDGHALRAEPRSARGPTDSADGR